MSVKTAELRALVTEAVREELLHTAQELLDIGKDETHEVMSQPTHDRFQAIRSQRVEKLAELRRGFSKATEAFLSMAEKREYEHYMLMGSLVETIGALQSEGRLPHDHSKDGLFFFAAASFYDGKVNSKEMKAFVDVELSRHYGLEAHHPQYELYNDGQECPEQAIIEMGIDRLSRNDQFSTDGVIRVDEVLKFMPTFPLGDNAGKQSIFVESVKTHIDIVQNMFYNMFPSRKL